MHMYTQLKQVMNVKSSLRPRRKGRVLMKKSSEDKMKKKEPPPKKKEQMQT